MTKTKTQYQKFESSMAKMYNEKAKRIKEIEEEKNRKKKALMMLQSEDVKIAFMKEMKKRSEKRRITKKEE